MVERLLAKEEVVGSNPIARLESPWTYVWGLLLATTTINRTRPQRRGRIVWIAFLSAAPGIKDRSLRDILSIICTMFVVLRGK